MSDTGQVPPVIEEETEPKLEELNKGPSKDEDCKCDTSSSSGSGGGSGDDANAMGKQKPTYIVPPIGTKGRFNFLEPFNKVMFNNQEYTVKAIRSLQEMNDSEEKPYDNIYAENELTEDKFKSDLDNNVPIIVLKNNGGNYFYVPATYLKSMPKNDGVKYQQVMMAINLGYLPLDFDYSAAEDIIKNSVKSSLGITSTIETLKTSVVQLVSEEEHNKFKKLLEGNKTEKHGYMFRYNMLLEQNKKLKQRIKLLNDCIILHIEAGKPIIKQPENEE